MEIHINNKIYYLNYSISKHGIYVEHFGIHKAYRGLYYSKRIFDSLIKKHNLSIELECWPTLTHFYQKIGFYKDGTTVLGYDVMIKPK